MSKHSGENTLLQIFRNIQETVNGLKELINAKQQPYIITADVDLATGTLINVSKSFEEIRKAFYRGDHVILQMDMSQMMPGLIGSLPLSAMMEGEASFVMVSYLSAPTLFLIGIQATGSASLMMVELADASD